MRIAARDISLYIPVRNAGRTLAAAIESVQRQTLTPGSFFLVLDTRSADASVEIARRSGVRIVEQTEGRLGLARNLAIRACETPWLASCDSDVTLEPGWLAALVDAADNRVAAVGGRTEERLITSADRWRAVNMPHNWGPAGFDNPFMLVSEMLARVAALRAVGGYRADLQYWEDSDACQRIRQAGFNLRYTPAALAWHDRRDTLTSVLELRWQYAAYRQRARLESLDGLIEKLAINRTYSLVSLSQTLHGPHPDVCALAIWLWMHHARRDLRAALELWPLLTVEDRAACDALAYVAIDEAWRDRWPCIAAISAAVCGGKTLPVGTGHAIANARGAETSFSRTAWLERYVAALRDATQRLLASIPTALDDALDSSASSLAGPTGGVFRCPDLRAAAFNVQRGSAMPTKPAWQWAEIESLTALDSSRVSPPPIRTLGPTLAAEMPTAGVALRSPENTERAGDLLLIPHVECLRAPAEDLVAALGRIESAVIAYHAPDGFWPTTQVLTARDLAALCASAGLQIADFRTHAGQTRLVLKRAAGQRPATCKPAETRTAVHVLSDQHPSPLSGSLCR